MAEEKDDSEKTEEPTPRKLEQARENGQVVFSKEVTTLFLFGAATLLVLLQAGSLGRETTRVLARILADADRIDASPEALMGTLIQAGIDVMRLLWPLALAFIGAAVGSSALQNAIVLSAKSLQPKFERVNPVAGFKRLASMQSLVEFAKSLAKFLVVGVTAGLVLWPRIDEVVGSLKLPVAALGSLIGELTLTILVAVTVVVSFIAALDWAYQRHRFMKQMRMSLKEVKDEHKQQEGDPIIKQRVRTLRMQRARQRMMAEVPSSTVVVTNPTHFAVALRYDTQQAPTPMVVAKGRDRVAQRIIEVARANRVPIVRNPPLARALHASRELGQTIQPEHYQAVAEVIGYVMRSRPHTS